MAEVKSDTASGGSAEKYVHPNELAPTLDGPGLLAEAKKRKERGNGFFTDGMADMALQVYLTAIWYLKLARPPYPEVLSGQVPPVRVVVRR